MAKKVSEILPLKFMDKQSNPTEKIQYLKIVLEQIKII